MSPTEQQMHRSETISNLPPVPPMPSAEQISGFATYDTGELLGSYTIEGTQSIPVDPELSRRMLAKDGPIPDYMITENAENAQRIGSRYQDAEGILMAAMQAAEQLRTEYAVITSQDNEAAESDLRRSVEQIASTKRELYKAIDQWEARSLQATQEYHDSRTRLNHQTATAVFQLREEVFRDFVNVLRQLRGGNEALAIQVRECMEAIMAAQRLSEEYTKNQSDLVDARGEFDSQHNTRQELMERKARLPHELNDLKQKKAAEADRLFELTKDAYKEEFAQYEENNDYQSLARRIKEIKENIVSSVTLSSLKGRIAQNPEEQNRVQQAISSCLATIGSITGRINELEKKAPQLLAQLITEHDRFAHAATLIGVRLERESNFGMAQAGAVEPAAFARQLFTEQDATRLGVHRIISATATLRQLLESRIALDNDKMPVNFDHTTDMPPLQDPYGTPVSLVTIEQSASDRETSGDARHGGDDQQRKIGRSFLQRIGFGKPRQQSPFLADQRELTQSN